VKRLAATGKPLKLTLTSRLADPSGNASVVRLKTKTRP